MSVQQEETMRDRDRRVTSLKSALFTVGKAYDTNRRNASRALAENSFTDVQHGYTVRITLIVTKDFYDKSDVPTFNHALADATTTAINMALSVAERLKDGRFSSSSLPHPMIRVDIEAVAT